MNQQPTFGEIAYEAYRSSGSLFWKELTPAAREQWEHAARAVIYAFVQFDGVRV